MLAAQAVINTKAPALEPRKRAVNPWQDNMRGHFGDHARVVPDMAHVSTSYVERSNLTMRMHMRRFTRLTNGFSKKVENHAYAVALHMMYYNFVKIHSKLRMSPAMAAGVSTKLWEIGDIAALVEAADAKPAKRGAYKKAALQISN